MLIFKYFISYYYLSILKLLLSKLEHQFFFTVLGHIPLSHWGPVKPYVQAHRFGATHLPPFRHPFSQTAVSEGRQK